MSAVNLGSVQLDECVVLSGISGRFPQSDNMRQFAENLYDKRDLVDDKETRWPHTMPEIPRRSGKINNLDKFDREFFGVSRNQCNAMDSQLRLLLEHAYEAIVDSGTNPETVRGSKTGVFVGVCFSETEARLFFQSCPPKGYAMLGCAKSQIANRISYVFDLRGPSLVLDTACSSSMYAMDVARRKILNGECDAALVLGTNLCLHPYISYQFSLLGVLAKDGVCRPFDEKANGYTRSEVICAAFLQKAKDANRIYAHILHSKTNCDGFKSEGITYPSGVMQKRLMSEFYDEISIDPRDIAYIEAHSTGTVVGDPEECDAIDKVFCTDRQRPMPIGSVKSNIGHSEASAALSSLAKCVIAMESDLIPPNINFTKNRADVPALNAGRLQVVDHAQPMEGPLIAINSFGFGGANAHMLIQRNTREKTGQGIPDDDLPRLITWSGRTKEAVEYMFQDICTRPLDVDFVALLHNMQRTRTPGHRYRGFAVFENRGSQPTSMDVFNINRVKLDDSPLVAIFPGITLRWREDLEALSQLPCVQQTVTECCTVLGTFGYDLFHKPSRRTDLRQLLIGSTVLQLAYADILTTTGVQLNAYGGHSIGQFTCAYLDGCLTLEQIVQIAYYHGSVLAEYKTEMNFNAFLELGSKRPAPPLSFDGFIQDTFLSRFGVVGGPLNPTCAVVDQLKSRGYVAEHLPFVSLVYAKDSTTELSEKLNTLVSHIIPQPLTPSLRWINLKNPSDFASTSVHDSFSIVNLLEKIPEHCMLLEPLAKQSMQPVLKSLNRKSKCMPFEKGTSTIKGLLSTLGHLYLTQQDLNLLNLYPPVQFPVARGTPMISPLIRWDHRDSWYVVRYEWVAFRVSNQLNFKVTLADQDFVYAAGHCIDGRVLFPATGYLSLVWELIAYLKQRELSDCPVQFDDVQFLRATTLTKNKAVNLLVTLQKGTGRFEIADGTTPVVTGFARMLETKHEHFQAIEENSLAPLLTSRDFYKELRLRGYHYNALFKSVMEAHSDGSAAKIQWKGNWVAFLDCLLQVGIVSIDTRSLMVPTAIESVTIYPKQHLSLMSRDDDGSTDYFNVSNCAKTNVCVSGGVRITGLRANVVSRRNPPGVPVLETYSFVPYNSTEEVSLTEAVRMCVQIALENAPTLSIRATEIYNDGTELLLPYFAEAVADLPLVQPTLTLLTTKDMEISNITVKNEKLADQTGLQFIISHNVLNDDNFLRDAMTSLDPSGFLVIRHSNTDVDIPAKLVKVASFINQKNQALILLQKTSNNFKESPAVIRVRSDDLNFEWLHELQNVIKIKPVLLYSQDDPISGIIGLVNCIKKELKSYPVRCVFIDDRSAPPFAQSEPFYKNQLSKDLTINVYRNGTWGSYRHALMDLKPKVESVRNHCFANCFTKGDLSSMTWFSGPLNTFSSGGELIRVVYSALNFRDVMIATSRLSSDVLHVNRLEQECLLGNEYSGVSVRGRRVMGVLPSGAMATLVECDPLMTWTIPDDWSLEEAATVPVVYGTVYTALFVCSRIRKGKSILIHAGSGGVGLAAIQVCLAYGMEVFSTVSTEEKKQFILKRYPRLKAENIGNSRDTSFENMIKLRTNGRGVDFVLNSLAEEKLQASLRCLSRNGHFLEIGKYDMANNSKIAMELFQKGISFTAVMLDAMFKGSFAEKQRLHALLTADMLSGVIKPLNTTVFPAIEIEKAFRFLASGKHIGKILLEIRSREDDAQTMPINYVPRMYCDPDCSYVIVGGLGGFGLELADWLILRGCRKLIISSSRGITKPYQEYRIRLWNRYGVRTLVNTANITTLEGCRELLREASVIGPVIAIFNLAVQLRDSILENQTPGKFSECLAPKAYATRFLDEVSRKLCPRLTHFVVFSSVSCGRGNAGQSNYGMANSMMERIVENRVAEGLPGKAIQWGAIGEVGIVADMAEDRLDMEIGGTLQQRISSCLQELDRLLMCDDPIVGSMVVAEKRIGGGSRNIMETVMNIMSIRDMKSVSMESTLADVGMDSLMAVEIKQVLESDFDLVLSPLELRTLTFMKLQKMVDEKRLNADAKTEMSARPMVIGMEMLLRNLGEEEHSAITLLPLPSKSTQGRPILIIPGLEGVAGHVWRILAAGLNAPVYMLQTLNTFELKSISEIVDHVFDELDKEVFAGFDDFFIVGYSFGTLIAYEIVIRLQRRNLPGKLILLDGAPKFLKQLSAMQMGNGVSDEDIQTMLMIAIISQVFPSSPIEKSYSIMQVASFDGQIERLIEVAKGQATYSPDYTRKMTKALFNRIKMVLELNVEEMEPLKVPIVLVRPSEVSVIDIDEEYGLEGSTTATMSMKVVDGSHMTMLDNKVLVDIINSLNV
ncbi:AAEL002237-PA [Aedes aegypti]|uniref:AAEL002237-PA n=1 Tax=Aedes aegypti TaxID=7159 RepID=Q17IW6_AEDAE|nr:AAEL002237-PA [Aedes aegypti]